MIPNMLSEVEACKREHPEAWRNAHTGNSHTEDFIKLLASRLHRINANFGLNGKRGNPNDLSDDAVNFKGEGPGHDPTNGNMPVTVVDVIGAAGSSGAFPTWQVFADLPGPGAWVRPTGATPAPEPQPPTQPTYPGDHVFDSVGAVLFADYAEAGQGPNAEMGRWFGRTIYDWLARVVPTLDDSIRKHRAEWRAALGLPPS